MVQCTQEMLFVKKILESIQLTVQLPMIISCDNKGAVDLANGHQVGGGTKHIDVRTFFIRELKEQGILTIKWIPSQENEADIHTKNTGEMVFMEHLPKYVGFDEYMVEMNDDKDTTGEKMSIAKTIHASGQGG